MALTPDAVERRTFPIADWGYDRGEVHKFLVEVAATLRYVQHASMAAAAPPPPPPPPSVAPPPPPTVDPLAPPAVVDLRADAVDLVRHDGRADAGRLGQRIVQILEAAETLAASIHADAEQALLVAQANAEHEVAEQRREAEAETTALREQAKGVLRASQEQAERIVAEAEEHAASLRSAADQRAKVRNQRLQRVAEQHAERVLRFERDAVDRLHDAQEDLRQAIERLTGSEHSPVLDLSSGQPSVRVGSIEVDRPRPEPVARRRVTERPTDRRGDEPNADAVNRLVQAAVERAVETGAQGSGSARPASPSPEPAAAD